MTLWELGDGGGEEGASEGNEREPEFKVNCGHVPQGLSSHWVQPSVRPIVEEWSRAKVGSSPPGTELVAASTAQPNQMLQSKWTSKHFSLSIVNE